MARGGLRTLPAETVSTPAHSATSISACRLVGFKMTIAKLSIFVSGRRTPTTSCHGQITRANRRVFHAGTQCHGRDRHSAARFGNPVGKCRSCAGTPTSSPLQDVSNLLARAGLQVGIGEAPQPRQRRYGLRPVRHSWRRSDRLTRQAGGLARMGLAISLARQPAA